MNLIVSAATVGAVIWAVIQLHRAIHCSPSLLLNAIEACRLGLVATCGLCGSGLVMAYIGQFPTLYSPLIDFTLSSAVAVVLGFVAYCCKPALNHCIVSFMAYMLGVTAVIVLALGVIDYLAPFVMGCTYSGIVLLGMYYGKVRYEQHRLLYELRRLIYLSGAHPTTLTN